MHRPHACVLQQTPSLICLQCQVAFQKSTWHQWVFVLWEQTGRGLFLYTHLYPPLPTPASPHHPISPCLHTFPRSYTLTDAHAHTLTMTTSSSHLWFGLFCEGSRVAEEPTVSASVNIPLRLPGNVGSCVCALYLLKCAAPFLSLIPFKAVWGKHWQIYWFALDLKAICPGLGAGLWGLGVHMWSSAEQLRLGRWHRNEEWIRLFTFKWASYQNHLGPFLSYSFIESVLLVKW